MLFSYIRRRLRKDNPRWVVLVIDMVIVLGCYVATHFLINNFKGSFDAVLMLRKSILVGGVYLLFFLWRRSYKGIVRETGLTDAMRIFATIVLAASLLVGLSMIIRYYYPRGTLIASYLRLSYGVILMHASLVMVCMVAARILYRSIYEQLFLPYRKRKNVLIFGASHPGIAALSLLHADRRHKYQVEAFVEDNESRVGQRLSGLKILHLRDIDIPYVKRMDIDEVIIAVENNHSERMLKVTDHFQHLGLELKIMPSAHSLLHEGTKQIRSLKIEDLLGRKPISLDNPAVRREMAGRRILVTGAAGSIGSELSRQIALQEYAELILLDQAESALYEVQQFFRSNGYERTHFVVGDVRDKAFMRHIFETYRPQIIFHAAAYKHVPLMEANPYEALWTNVYGSRVVADLALEFEVYKFVMVSTDKAVNPTNVMGASKRAAEIYVSSCAQRGTTHFIITRFGNVLGSNGSVIPLFEKQLEQGGPLTLTHPDITRYFMTIPEACLLVQEAAAMGKGGEVFVFDMGESVKIMDLAKRMIKLKGLRYPEDIDIEVIGLRPGEKIFEELLADDENTVKTHHPKIMIAQFHKGDLQEKWTEIVTLCSSLEEKSSLQFNNLDLVRRLKAIVPEYKSQNSDYETLDRAEHNILK